MKLTLSVNGRPWSGDVAQRVTLADFLRDHLGLTGTHLGCEQGVCGACTVLAEGKAVRSCLMLAVQSEGLQIRTIEGLASDPRGAALQEAFLRHGAFQCGFCTPGFLVSAADIVASGRRHTRDQLRELLGGNVCRCTGYQSIVEAVFECQG